MHAATTGLAGPADAAQAHGAGGTWVSERHWVRRPLDRPFWVTALLIPLLLTALVAVSQAPAVERSAQERAERALGEAGLDTVRVVVDGRRVLARVPRGTRDAKVRATLLAVPGIWLVGTVPRTAPSPDGARTHREGGARAVRRQAPAGERSR